MKIKQSLAWKIMDHIRERKFEGFDHADLDELEAIIKDEQPEIHERWNEDNPKEPNDGEAWSGGIADNH